MNNIFRRKSQRCPRCGHKSDIESKVCSYCELNFDKLSQATNQEAKTALKNREKDRVVYTTNLPKDISKWKLFFLTLFLGWTGAYLWSVGRFKRAITHFVSLLCGAICITISFTGYNAFFYNVMMISGAFWVICFSLVLVDIIEIPFNQFKVPVSLPYSKKD